MEQTASIISVEYWLSPVDSNVHNRCYENFRSYVSEFVDLWGNSGKKQSDTCNESW
jgi:hypothetical protein